MPKTLFILLNHALTDAQKSEAKERFNIEKFVNITNEKWSNIPPQIDNLSDFLSEFALTLKSNAKKGDYLFIQGDFGATYTLVRFAINLGITPIYATTRRIYVEVIENGEKIIKKSFIHERFRAFREFD